MKSLERKMFQPDCDNPSGRYPHPKYHCDECGEKTAVEYNAIGMRLCSKCRRDNSPEEKPE